MTRLSNVGNPSIYEAGDQRTSPKAHTEPKKKDPESSSKMHEEHEHRTPQQRREEPHKRAQKEENERLRQDPTKPAEYHYNEPSKGAKIDKVLKEEDEEELKRIRERSAT